MLAVDSKLSGLRYSKGGLLLMAFASVTTYALTIILISLCFRKGNPDYQIIGDVIFPLGFILVFLNTRLMDLFWLVGLAFSKNKYAIYFDKDHIVYLGFVTIPKSIISSVQSFKCFNGRMYDPRVVLRLNSPASRIDGNPFFRLMILHAAKENIFQLPRQGMSFSIATSLLDASDTEIENYINNWIQSK